MTAGERLEALERMTTPQPDDPEAEAVRLREDIAQTRENIGSTINAIQEKLSPAAIAQQARSAVREATIGKVETMVESAESTISQTGYSISQTIRRHPFSATLAGVGLAWLWMHRRRDMQEYKQSFQRREGFQREGFQREGITGSVRSKAGDVVHKVEDMAERAQESIGEATHDAGERVKSLAREAKARGVYMESRLEDIYYDRPLAVGAVALAAGTALGLAIPITHREEQLLGKTRDQVVEKVTEMAQEAMGQVQQATAGGE